MNENVKPLERETRGTAFALGLNPYGLTYHLGLQGAGGPRADPKGAGLEGFIAIASELGAKVLEIYDPWLRALSVFQLFHTECTEGSKSAPRNDSGGLHSDRRVGPPSLCLWPL